MAAEAPETLPEPGDPRALYVVDLNHYVFRHVSAVGSHGAESFARWFGNLLDQRRPARIACADDAPGESFRAGILREAGLVGEDGYKANRRRLKDEQLATLVDQREEIRAFVRDAGVPIVSAPGFEADDVIATIARWATDSWVECPRCARLSPVAALPACCAHTMIERIGAIRTNTSHHVVIVSSDTDLLQLVGRRLTGGTCVLWDGAFEVSGPDGCRRTLGVPPERVPDFFAVKGGKNNVPGVRGLGAVKAAALLQKADLESWVSATETVMAKLHPGDVKPAWVEALLADAEMARLSLRLTRLRDDVPLDFAALARDCRFSVAK